jgi:hypothetical protein
MIINRNEVYEMLGNPDSDRVLDFGWTLLGKAPRFYPE